jgi:hypothetical protein
MDEQTLTPYAYRPDAGISNYVLALFEEFKNNRKPYEEKAEEHWYNFLSQYQASRNWRIKEGEGNRSRLFVKVTQQKCYTAHAKTMEAIGDNVPFDFEAMENLDYSAIPAEIVREAALYRKRYLTEYFKYIKLIDTLDDSVLSATIFPAAILKGPIMVTERQPVVKRRMIAGVPAEQIDPSASPFMVAVEPVEKYICEEVPWWDYYVDCNVKKNRQSIGEIHYKRLSKQEFRDLIDDPGYDRTQLAEAIREVDNLANSLEDAEEDKTSQQLGDKFNGFEAIKDNKVPIVEFWGLVSAKSLREYGADVPENIRDDEDCEACVTIVKAGSNPIIKAQYNFYGYRPFMVYGVKKIPNSVYKNSTAGLMDDSQSMINSGTRMFVDGKALSGNGCIGVNKDKIDWTRTGSAEIYPRKTFFVKGNHNPSEALGSITFPDVTYGLREMIELFVRFADEETGIPKYTQGADQASFLNKTASGMSMIMGAANLNLKPFLKNIDDNVIEPLVERYDALFSMLGKYPPQFNIPLKVVATGTVSMMARELIVENLMRLLQITQNPQDAMLVNRRSILKDIAEKLGLAKFVNSDEEIQRIERMMAERQNQMQVEPNVSVDKIFQFMTPGEQAQVIAAMGVQPDPRRMPPAPPPQQGPAGFQPAQPPQAPGGMNV